MTLLSQTDEDDEVEVEEDQEREEHHGRQTRRDVTSFFNDVPAAGLHNLKSPQKTDGRGRLTDSCS